MGAFRIILVALALIIGSCAFISTLADIGSLDRPAFPTDPAKIASPWAGEVPDWVGVVSPLRSDLEAGYALIAALQALQRGKQGQAPAEDVRARARVKQALSIAPYDAELWLALALLQARSNPRDPTLPEALKMAYFTAPNDTRLMPVRLDTATMFDALADPDVNELARGDLRLMITRQPDLRPAVISAYRRASSIGKTFLEQAVQSIDPSFLPAMRG